MDETDGDDVSVHGKVSREIQCLQRLQETTQQLDEIIYFLKQELLIDDGVIRTVKQQPDHAKEVQKLLSGLKAAGKLQLCQYEWTVLPVENIRIFIITDRNQKEFTFGG